MNWWTTLAILFSVVAAAVVVTPDRDLRNENGQSFKLSTLASPSLLKLLHLTSFSAAFGVSLWVTFIGGIIMFRTLPRHQFGNLQSQLFPAYFRLMAIASSICLASFVASHPLSSGLTVNTLQTTALIVSLGGSLANLLVFEPWTVKVMRERHRVEKEAGIGNEVGLSRNREVAKTNPELAKVNKKFGFWHGLSSLSNLVALGGIGVHLWYLSSRLSW